MHLKMKRTGAILKFMYLPEIGPQSFDEGLTPVFREAKTRRKGIGYANRKSSETQILPPGRPVHLG
jgi:hypothetical protein